MTPTKDQLTSDTEWLADHFAKHGWPGASVGAQAAERILHALSTVDLLRGEVERQAEANRQLHEQGVKMYADRQASEAGRAALVEALEDVVDPLGYLQRLAEGRGHRLDRAAYQIANNLAFVQSIASQALKAVTPTTSDGDIGEASQSLRSVPQRAVPEADYQASEVDQ